MTTVTNTNDVLDGHVGVEVNSGNRPCRVSDLKEGSRDG